MHRCCTTDAVGDIAAFEVANADDFTREKLPVTLLMPFGNRELPRSEWRQLPLHLP